MRKAAKNASSWDGSPTALATMTSRTQPRTRETRNACENRLPHMLPPETVVFDLRKPESPVPIGSAKAPRAPTVNSDCSRARKAKAKWFGIRPSRDLLTKTWLKLSKQNIPAFESSRIAELATIS